jgi:hypothetical protein
MTEYAADAIVEPMFEISHNVKDTTVQSKIPKGALQTNGKKEKEKNSLFQINNIDSIEHIPILAQVPC